MSDPRNEHPTELISAGRVPELEAQVAKLQAKLAEAEKKVSELSRLAEHGNGPVLLGWMDAHRKAMDRLEAAEAKIKHLMQTISVVQISLRKNGHNEEDEFIESHLRKIP